MNFFKGRFRLPWQRFSKPSTTTEQDLTKSCKSSSILVWGTRENKAKETSGCFGEFKPEREDDQDVSVDLGLAVKSVQVSEQPDTKSSSRCQESDEERGEVTSLSREDPMVQTIRDTYTRECDSTSGANLSDSMH